MGRYTFKDTGSVLSCLISVHVLELENLDTVCHPRVQTEENKLTIHKQNIFKGLKS